jgi:hypothetical protein
MISFFSKNTTRIFYILLVFLIDVKYVYADSGPTIDNPLNTNDVKSFLEKFASMLIPWAGVIFIIMLLYGGIQYLTSGGNEENSSKAKNTLTWAIVGIIIVTLAFVFVKYIKGKLLS